MVVDKERGNYISFNLMKKTLAVSVYLADIIMLVALCVYAARDQRLASARRVLYHKTDCPHCANVDKFLEGTGGADKAGILRAEVSENPRNAISHAQRALRCGLASDNLPLPLLWDGDKCIVGDKDIITYLGGKADDLQKN